MLKTLYGEADVPGKSRSAKDAQYAKAKYEEQVRSRRELKSTYCGYLLFSVFFQLCCCFRACCMRSNHFRDRAKNYRKFKLALARLR